MRYRQIVSYCLPILIKCCHRYFLKLLVLTPVNNIPLKNERYNRLNKKPFSRRKRDGYRVQVDFLFFRVLVKNRQNATNDSAVFEDRVYVDDVG